MRVPRAIKWKSKKDVIRNGRIREQVQMKNLCIAMCETRKTLCVNTRPVDPLVDQEDG